jgi:hypothetical protein
MFPGLAVSDEPRTQSGEAQHIAEILPLLLAKYLTHETHRVSRVELRPTHNAFPLRLDLSTGSPLSVGGGPFSFTSIQG